MKRFQKKNKKNAQVNEMFTYILSIIIIGLILLFGIRYIIKLQQDIKTIDLVKFKTQVETVAGSYAYQYGSWVKQEFSVPSEVKQVCFFDVEKAGGSSGSKICGGSAQDPNEIQKQPLLCDGWSAGKDSTQNVMTVPFVTETPIHIGKIEVDNAIGYKCFKVTAGKFTATITGLGDGVKIS